MRFTLLCIIGNALIYKVVTSFISIVHSLELGGWERFQGYAVTNDGMR